MACPGEFKLTFLKISSLRASKFCLSYMNLPSKFNLVSALQLVSPMIMLLKFKGGDMI